MEPFKKPTPAVNQLWQLGQLMPICLTPAPLTEYGVRALLCDGSPWRCVGYQCPDGIRVLVGERRRVDALNTCVVMAVVDRDAVLVEFNDSPVGPARLNAEFVSKHYPLITETFSTEGHVPPPANPPLTWTLRADPNDENRMHAYNAKGQHLGRYLGGCVVMKPLGDDRQKWAIYDVTPTGEWAIYDVTPTGVLQFKQIYNYGTPLPSDCVAAFLPRVESPTDLAAPQPITIGTSDDVLRAAGRVQRRAGTTATFTTVFNGLPPPVTSSRDSVRREVDAVLAEDARRHPAFATARRAAVSALFEKTHYGPQHARTMLDGLHLYEAERGGGRQPRVAPLVFAAQWGASLAEGNAFTVYERARHL